MGHPEFTGPYVHKSMVLTLLLSHTSTPSDSSSSYLTRFRPDSSVPAHRSPFAFTLDGK